jgi:hypothetical protein
MRDDGIPIRRRTARRRPWVALVAILLVGAGLVGAAYFRLGPRADAGDPAPDKRMTQKELVAFIQSKGVKCKFLGNGVLSKHDSREATDTYGGVRFQWHRTPEAARLTAGADPDGFVWGQWSFHPWSAEVDELAPAIRKALGVK